MTDKELKGLKRSELLEILLELRKRYDAVTAENETLKQRIEEAESSRLARLDKMLSELYDDRFGRGSAAKLADDDGGSRSPEEPNDGQN